jgi:hypothetical protein
MLGRIIHTVHGALALKHGNLPVKSDSGKANVEIVDVQVQESFCCTCRCQQN